MSSCLFHQKLQMLNCCIQHKRKHDHSTSSDTSGTQVKSPPKTTGTGTHSTGPQSTGPRTTGLPSPQSSGPQPNTSRGRATSPKSEGSDTDEDEFFEALESQDRGSSGSDESQRVDVDEKIDEDKEEEGEISGNVESESGRSGILRQCGDLVLVATGEPLYIPITQVRRICASDLQDLVKTNFIAIFLKSQSSLLSRD